MAGIPSTQPSRGDLAESEASEVLRANRRRAKESREPRGINVIYKDNLVIGNLTTALQFGGDYVVKSPRPKMDATNNRVAKDMILRSDVPIDQRAEGNTVGGSLELIISTTESRAELKRQLNLLADAAAKLKPTTNNGVSDLREAAQKADSGDVSGLRSALSNVPIFLLKLAKDIGVSVAEKAIENAMV